MISGLIGEESLRKSNTTFPYFRDFIDQAGIAVPGSDSEMERGYSERDVTRF